MRILMYVTAKFASDEYKRIHSQPAFGIVQQWNLLYDTNSKSIDDNPEHDYVILDN